jgi:hypothetical protein
VAGPRTALGESQRPHRSHGIRTDPGAASVGGRTEAHVGPTYQVPKTASVASTIEAQTVSTSTSLTWAI